MPGRVGLRGGSCLERAPANEHILPNMIGTALQVKFAQETQFVRIVPPIWQPLHS